MPEAEVGWGRKAAGPKFPLGGMCVEIQCIADLLKLI